MFGILLVKECKEILKSITYYIFLGCITLFFITQMGKLDGMAKPVQGQENYGYIYSNDSAIIMPSALEQLVQEYDRNEYTTYPFGFYKQVKLNEEKQKRVTEIILELTGYNEIQLKSAIEQYWNDSNSMVLKVKDGLSYEEFKIYMKKVDDLLGGGSQYDVKRLKQHGRMPMTYETALSEYEDIISKDKVSGAYARLFSDYMGIILAILPVFLAVNRGLKDERAKASDVIFSKKASSVTIILARYVATIVMILVPLMLISINPTLQSMYIASSNSVDGDWFAFIKYIFVWLLPIILFTVSIGFFFTELTNGPVAILIQGIWWFVSIFLGAMDLIGHVGMNLIPRFNDVGSYQVYSNIFKELVLNRLGYSFISIVILIATIMIFHLKRKGTLLKYGKILRNNKGKLEV
jgi:hypothetical protein